MASRRMLPSRSSLVGVEGDCKLRCRAGCSRARCPRRCAMIRGDSSDACGSAQSPSRSCALRAPHAIGRAPNGLQGTEEPAWFNVFNADGALAPPGDRPGPGEAATVAQGWWLVGWLSCGVFPGTEECFGLGPPPPSQLRSAPPHRRHVQAGDAVTVCTSRQRGVKPRPGRLSPFLRGHSGPAGRRGAHCGLVVVAAGAALPPLGTLARSRVASRGRPARTSPSIGPGRSGAPLGWKGDKQVPHCVLMLPLASACRRRRGCRPLAATNSYSALLHNGILRRSSWLR